MQFNEHQLHRDVLFDLSAVLLAYDGAWEPEAIEKAMTEFAESKDLKMGKVAQPLRAALTGTTASPGIYEVVWVLGKQEVLDRINDVLTKNA